MWRRSQTLPSVYRPGVTKPLTSSTESLGQKPVLQMISESKEIPSRGLPIAAFIYNQLQLFTHGTSERFRTTAAFFVLLEVACRPFLYRNRPFSLVIIFTLVDAVNHSAGSFKVPQRLFNNTTDGDKRKEDIFIPSLKTCKSNG